MFRDEPMAEHADVAVALNTLPIGDVSIVNGNGEMQALNRPRRGYHYCGVDSGFMSQWPVHSLVTVHGSIRRVGR